MKKLNKKAYEPETITVKHKKKYLLAESCENLWKDGFSCWGGCYKEDGLFVQNMIK